MKKIIGGLVLAALCAGCSKSNEKLDELSKQITALQYDQRLAITNEFVLYGEIQELKNQVTNLPNLTQIDNMTFYYHTNEMDVMRQGFAGIDRANSGFADVDNSILGAVSGIMTNELHILEAPDDNSLSKQIDDIQARASMIEWDLTNPPPTGPLYDDLEQIKTKLGIY